jgi:hypothetical protein
MTLRYGAANTSLAIAVAGTTVPHGLAQIPDEVWGCMTALGNVATSNSLYMYSAATSTNVYFACGSAACSAVIYAAKKHPWVK